MTNCNFCDDSGWFEPVPPVAAGESANYTRERHDGTSIPCCYCDAYKINTPHCAWPSMITETRHARWKLPSDGSVKFAIAVCLICLAISIIVVVRGAL